MERKIGVFAGTFDPFTNGHMYVIEKSRNICEKICIGLLDNPEKCCMFDKTYRMKMLEYLYEDDPMIDVVCFDGMAVDFLKMVNGNMFIRGYRNSADFEYEKKMRDFNYSNSGADTYLIETSEQFRDVTSTIVRKKIADGMDYSEYIPDKIKIMIDSYVKKQF